MFRQLRYDAVGAGPADLNLGVQELMRPDASLDVPMVSSNVRPTVNSTAVALGQSIKSGSTRYEVYAALDSAFVPSGYAYLDPATAIRERVKAAQSEGTVTVVISHQPLSKLREMVRALPQMQIVVSNTAELPRATRIGSTWIVPGPSSGREMCRVSLGLDGGKVQTIESETIRITANIEPDLSITERIRSLSKSNRTVTAEAAFRKVSDT